MEIRHHSLPAKANFGPIESDFTAISTTKPRPAGSQPELRRVVWNRQVQHYEQLSFLARHVAYFPSELHSAKAREASFILPGRSLGCSTLNAPPEHRLNIDPDAADTFVLQFNSLAAWTDPVSSRCVL